MFDESRFEVITYMSGGHGLPQIAMIRVLDRYTLLGAKCKVTDKVSPHQASNRCKVALKLALGVYDE